MCVVNGKCLASFDKIKWNLFVHIVFSAQTFHLSNLTFGRVCTKWRAMRTAFEFFAKMQTFEPNIDPKTKINCLWSAAGEKTMQRLERMMFVHCFCYFDLFHFISAPKNFQVHASELRWRTVIWSCQNWYCSPMSSPQPPAPSSNSGGTGDSSCNTYIHIWWYVLQPFVQFLCQCTHSSWLYCQFVCFLCVVFHCEKGPHWLIWIKHISHFILGEIGNDSISGDCVNMPEDIKVSHRSRKRVKEVKRKARPGSWKSIFCCRIRASLAFSTY